MFSVPLETDIGVITAWAGAIGNIPPGWHLCDGDAGTVDLQDRFVVAAGPIFSVGDHSENQTHEHDLTTDGHFHGLLNPPGHLGFGSGFTTTTGTRPDTATTDFFVNLPKTYALAYIQFIGP